MSVDPTKVAVESLIAMLQSRTPRPLTIDDLARLMGLQRYDRKQMRGLLEGQVAAGVLRRIGKTRYQWRRPEPERQPREKAAPSTRLAPGRKTTTVEGHYSRVMAGYGFVEVLGVHTERFARDILIPEGMEGTALHGDQVRVEITGRDPRRRRSIGRIVAVMERVHEYVLGTLVRNRHGWLVEPQNRLLPPVSLTGDNLPAAEQVGLVARVRLTQPGSPTRGQLGELESVLGSADDPEVQFLTIAADHGLATEFPPAVLAEVAGSPTDPVAEDLSDREDLRALPFVTIDGESARDFDDAVCLQRLDNGEHRLWVAIADVSHYVRPGTALDREAARRGTSVYFPDRAIPMLPPQLSSELCSLRPGRPRLVWTCEMNLDQRGKRTATRVYRAVIESRARLTYTQVAAWLDEPSPQPSGEIVAQLRAMQGLMRLLHRRRIKAGSLDLDLPEALIDLSEEGRSIGVRVLERNDAHRLIEELMLEANRAVAELLTGREIPLPYRVHEPPHPDSINDLNQFLAPFGFHVDYDDVVRPKDVQRTLSRIEGHRLARVLTRQLLRALTKAHYSTRNSGHFGLAFPTYCHFTSPIRRYPDLLVHRQLAHAFRSDTSNPSDSPDQSDRSDLIERLQEHCVHSSHAEREAMTAERDMLDLKKAEFMLGHLNEAEAGTVVSVTDFGFYVELEKYPVDGLVRVDSLGDDRYRLVERERALRGGRTGRRIRLGDRVMVECVEASTQRRTIDFRILNIERSDDGRRGMKTSRPRRRH